MFLMKKYIFNIIEKVEITTNIANEIYEDTSDSTKIKKILEKYVVIIHCMLYSFNEGLVYY